MEQKDKMVLLYDMWKGENATKTNKLMAFFVVQAILVSAFELTFALFGAGILY